MPMSARNQTSIQMPNGVVGADQVGFKGDNEGFGELGHVEAEALQYFRLSFQPIRGTGYSPEYTNKYP